MHLVSKIKLYFANPKILGLNSLYVCLCIVDICENLQGDYVYLIDVREKENSS